MDLFPRNGNIAFARRRRKKKEWRRIRENDEIQKQRDG